MARRADGPALNHVERAACSARLRLRRPLLTHLSCLYTTHAQIMKRSGKCIAGSALVGTLALIGFAVTSSLSRPSGTSTRRPDIVDLATGTTAAPYATITQPDIEAATVADFKYPMAAAKDPVRWLRPLRACAFGASLASGRAPLVPTTRASRRVALLLSPLGVHVPLPG